MNIILQMHVPSCFYKVINVTEAIITPYKKYVLSASFSSKMITCTIVFVILFNTEVFGTYLHFYGPRKANKTENYE